MKTPLIPPQFVSVLNDVGRFLPMLSLVYRPTDPRVARFLAELPVLIAAVNSGDTVQLQAAASRGIPMLKALLTDLRSNPLFGDLLNIIASSDVNTIEADLAAVATKA